MRARPLALPLVLLAGCTGRAVPPAPDARLPTGAEVITYHHDGDAVLAFVPYRKEDGRAGETVEAIDVGLRAVVVEDPGPSVPRDRRYVRVSVKEGAYRGVARIGRDNLRPVGK